MSIPEYNPSNTYNENDVVLYNGQKYIYTRSISSRSPNAVPINTALLDTATLNSTQVAANFTWGNSASTVFPFYRQFNDWFFIRPISGKIPSLQIAFECAFNRMNTNAIFGFNQFSVEFNWNGEVFINGGGISTTVRHTSMVQRFGLIRRTNGFTIYTWDGSGTTRTNTNRIYVLYNSPVVTFTGNNDIGPGFTSYRTWDAFFEYKWWSLPVWDAVPADIPIPRSIRPIAFNGRLEYNWDNTDPYVSSFTLQLRGTTTTTVSLPADSREYIFTGLTNGTSYTLSMYSTSSGGAESSTTTFLPAQPGNLPSAPQSVSATKSGTNGLSLTWTAPASNGGSEIQWYALLDRRRIPGDVRIGIEPFKRAHVASPIPDGTYTFDFCAINSAGYGTLVPVGTFTFP